MMYSHAIVLSAADNTSVPFLLDKFRGKIRPFLVQGARATRFVRGAVLECIFAEESAHVVVQAEICAVPHAWAFSDILFLHQVIELCLVFLPEAQEAGEVYEFLHHIYVPRRSSRLLKKLFLCRLLFLLHVYEEHWFDKDLVPLISCWRDSMFETDEDADLEKKAAQWLSRVSLLEPGRLKTFGMYYEDV